MCLCTHVSQIDVSYVGRCHSSRVAPFIGTSSPAVDTLLRCHVQPFCEPVALHNSSAAWKICPHKVQSLSIGRLNPKTETPVSPQSSQITWIRHLFDVNTTFRQALFQAGLILRMSKTKNPGHSWSIFEVKIRFLGFGVLIYRDK